MSKGYRSQILAASSSPARDVRLQSNSEGAAALPPPIHYTSRAQGTKLPAALALLRADLAAAGEHLLQSWSARDLAANIADDPVQPTAQDPATVADTA